jgi:hypothetical protein
MDATPSAASPSSNNVDPASGIDHRDLAVELLQVVVDDEPETGTPTGSLVTHPFTLVLPDRGRLAGQEAVVGPDAA